MESDKPGPALRSLLLGYYDCGKLVFAGKAGTGFDLKTGHELVARLRELECPDPPFAAVPRAYQQGSPLGRAEAGGGDRFHELDRRPSAAPSFLRRAAGRQAR